VVGLDFIKRARPTFEKTWSRGLRDLSEPNLFNSPPGESSHSLIANLFSMSVKAEEELLAVSDGTGIVLTRGVTKLGCIDQPSAELLQQIKDMGGFAYLRVDRINLLSETAEVRVWRWDSDENK
jgi:hypothetical protein